MSPNDGALVQRLQQRVQRAADEMVGSGAVSPRSSHFNAGQEIWNFVTTNARPAVARSRPGASA
jgi:hypothetical protein